MDQNHVLLFRRVVKVQLTGRQFNKDLLPKLSQFKELKELEVLDTAIEGSELEAWQKEHPRVVVTQHFLTLTR